MRISVIACKVLLRELYYLSWNSPHIVEIWPVKQGLHNEPDNLRRKVQAMVDTIEDNEEDESDAICLGYGLCSNGVAGVSSQKIPIVIPRGHDCITLLLGSKERYRELFDSHNGVYWYAPGWIEQSHQPGKERYEQQFREYVEKYGEDNAEYLMDMEQNWMKNYNWAIYIDWQEFDNGENIRYTQECAQFLDWQCKVVPGESALLRDMLRGEWNDSERFLVIPPGQVISPSYDEYIFKAAPKDAQLDLRDTPIGQT